MRIDIHANVEAGFLNLTKNQKATPVITLKQVHGAKGYQIKADGVGNRSEGDWLWTDVLGLSVGVAVADCTAFLWYGQSSKMNTPFVAAIHAGWRGTAAKIIEEAYDTIRPKEGWALWASPSICQKHFEVGKEVLDALGEAASRFAKPVRGRPEKFLLDLKAFQIEIWKQKSSKGKIDSSPLCTYCESNLYSYRRLGPQLKNRHLAWIRLKE